MPTPSRSIQQFGERKEQEAGGMLRSRADVIKTVVVLGIWLLPICYTNFNRRPIEQAGLFLNQMYRISCLFTERIDGWSNYHYQVRVRGGLDWIEVPDSMISTMLPFAYRTRIDRMIGDSNRDPRGKILREDIAAFVKKRYEQENPDSADVVQVRVLRSSFRTGDERIARPKGHWKKPKISEVLLSDLSIAHSSSFGDSSFFLEDGILTGRPSFDDLDMKMACLNESIHQLILNGTQVTDAGLRYVSRMKRLRAVELEDTPVGDETAARLSTLPDLSFVNLRRARVTDRGARYLAKLEKLEYLYLEGTEISDRGVRYFENHRPLKSILLGRTEITDRSLSYLKNHKTLRFIFLEGTRVTDAGLQYLHEMNQMEWVRLRGTLVTDEGVALLREKMPNARIDR